MRRFGKLPYGVTGGFKLKALLHYCAGAIISISLGSAVLILRVPLRKSAGREFGTIDQVFAVIIIGIGVVYAFLAVRQYLVWWDENRRRRRKKRP
jgi:hypothetical protein